MSCRSCYYSGGSNKEAYSSDGHKCTCNQTGGANINYSTSTGTGGTATTYRFYCQDQCDFCQYAGVGIPCNMIYRVGVWRVPGGCIQCENNNCGNPSWNDRTKIAVKHDLNGAQKSGTYEVVTCWTAGGYYADDLREKCIWCGEFMTFTSGACACKSGHKMTTNGKCILNNGTVNVTAYKGIVFYNLIDGTARYPTTGTSTSAYIEYYIEWAAYTCYKFHDDANNRFGGELFEVCQIISNIAALQDFNNDFYSTVMTTLDGYVPKLKWLINDQHTNILQDVFNVESKWSPVEGVATDVYSKLRFILFMYDEKGKFIASEPLANQLYFCEHNTYDSELFYYIGVNYRSECELNVRYLLQKNTQTIFYELYLYDANRTGDKLVKIPIKNNNTGINSTIDETFVSPDIDLTYRFVLVDHLSGLTSYDPDKYTAPVYARYAKDFKFEIKILDKETIYIPYLEITYKSVNYSLLISDPSYPQMDTFKFEFKYWQDETFLVNFAMVTFFITVVLVCLTILMKIFINERKRPLERSIQANICMDFLLRTVYQVIDSCSHYGWYYLMFIVGYVYCFYKWQNGLTIMIPQLPIHYIRFELFLFGVIGSYAFTMILRLYKQVSTEFYLLDMEPTTNAYTSSGGGVKDSHTPCWRRLFVANELTRLFCTRYINMEVTIIALVYIYYNYDITQYSLEKPFNVTLDIPLAPNSEVFQFFVDSLLLFGLGIAQIIYYRVISLVLPSQHANFVDLCTVCNISVFVVDEALHGYYIHGYSHTNSDTSFAELIIGLDNKGDPRMRQLKDSGEKVFEVFFNEKCRKGLDNLLTDGYIARHKQADNNKAKVVDQAYNKDYMEIIKIYNERRLNFERFWKEVLQTPVFKGKSVNVRVFSLPEGVLATETRPLFYLDPELTFDSVFLQGMDYYIIIMDSLCFATCNYYLGSLTFSAFITYLLDKAYCFLRGYLGSIVLANSTFIQHKFLIEYNKYSCCF